MFKELADWVMNAGFTNTAGFILYWIPVAFCFVYFVLDFFKQYRNDLVKCKQEYYRPEATVGSLFWSIIAPFIPLYNIAVFVFSVIPSITGYIFVDVFKIAFVPSKYVAKENDEDNKNRWN